MNLDLYVMEDNEFALLLTDPFGRVFVIGVGQMCSPELADMSGETGIKGMGLANGDSPNLEGADSCPSKPFLFERNRPDLSDHYLEAERYMVPPSPRIDIRKMMGW